MAIQYLTSGRPTGLTALLVNQAGPDDRGPRTIPSSQYVLRKGTWGQAASHAELSRGPQAHPSPQALISALRVIRGGSLAIGPSLTYNDLRCGEIVVNLHNVFFFEEEDWPEVINVLIDF